MKDHTVKEQTALEDDDLLTHEEAARFLSRRMDWPYMSSNSLRGLRSGGNGPAFVRIGRLLRYRRSDLIAWLNVGRHKESIKDSLIEALKSADKIGNAELTNTIVKILLSFFNAHRLEILLSQGKQRGYTVFSKKVDGSLIREFFPLDLKKQ